MLGFKDGGGLEAFDGGDGLALNGLLLLLFFRLADVLVTSGCGISSSSSLKGFDDLFAVLALALALALVEGVVVGNGLDLLAANGLLNPSSLSSLSSPNGFVTILRGIL
jgi:hypothetical protein